MRTRSLFSLLAVFILVLTACSSSKKTPAYSSEKWQKIGEKRVNYTIDHDVLNVTYRDGTFKQLRFGARGGSINVYRCVIHFENGESQEIDLRNTFRKGSKSRIVDLDGSRRLIDKISFWYDTKDYSANKAVVVIWGK